LRNLTFIISLSILTSCASFFGNRGEEGPNRDLAAVGIKQLAKAAENDFLNIETIGSYMQTSVFKLRDSLNDEQKSNFILPLDNRDLEKWSWVPVIRDGLRWVDMNPEQQQLCTIMVRMALSLSGFRMADDIQTIDNADRDQTRWWLKPFLDKGRDNYTVKIYGDPASNNWVWRFHGHHLVLTLAMINGKPVSISPTVFGVLLSIADPNGAFVLSEVRTEAHKFAMSLSPEQKAVGVSAALPGDLIMGNRKTLQNQELKRVFPLGIEGKDLTKRQKANLLKVVERYLNYYKREIAEQELQQIEDKGLDAIDFLWAGNIEAHSYFRVQGPTFVLELDTYNGDHLHLHTVYRNLINDNGYDALQAHYQNDHDSGKSHHHVSTGVTHTHVSKK